MTKSLIPGFHFTDEAITSDNRLKLIMVYLRETMPQSSDLSDKDLLHAVLAAKKNQAELDYFEETPGAWEAPNPANLGDIVAKTAFDSLWEEAYLYYNEDDSFLAHI